MAESQSRVLTHSQIKELTQLMCAFYVERDDSKLDRLFQLYDLNSNGSISASELKLVMKAISPEGVDDETIHTMIEEADTNHNGEIELDEFRAVMINRRDA